MSERMIENPNSSSTHTQQTIYQCLKKSRLFDPLPDSLVRKLTGFLRKRSFEASDYVTREGARGSEIHFLIKGKVSVYSGGELILTLKRLGDMCGEMSVITNKPSYASEVAETAVEVLSLDTSELINLPTVKSSDLNRLLFRLYSSMLTDKFKLTTVKARGVEHTRAELSKAKKQLIGALEKCAKDKEIKDCFLDNISHELRTPMHGIMGMTNLMQDTELSTKQKEYTKLIQRSAAKLMTNITDVLGYADLENQSGETVRVCPFSIRQTVDKIKEELQLKAKSNNVTINTDISPEIPDLLAGDMVRIHQILINLVSHSIDTLKSGDVTLKVDQAAKYEDNISTRFSVEFSTDGVPKDTIDKSLAEYTQKPIRSDHLDARSNLGLVIARQLIKIMDGEIGTITDKETSLLFWFTLNLTVSENRRKLVQHTLPLDRTRSRSGDLVDTGEFFDEPKGRILLIENDNVTRLVIKLMLRKMGYDVLTTSNDLKAASAIQLLDFDMILTDVTEESDGDSALFTILKKTGKNKLNVDTPVIAYTSKKRSAVELNLFDNINELVFEPFSDNNLRTVVENWLPDNRFRN